MKKYILAIGIIFCIIVAILLVQKRKNSVTNTPTPKQPTIRIKIINPKEKIIKKFEPFLAKVEAYNTANIASKFTANINKIKVKEGEHVKKGQSIVAIDDTEISTSLHSLYSQIRSAVKQKTFANNQYKRNKILYNAGGLSKEKLDASEIILAQSDASIIELNQKKISLLNQLKYLNIRAPFDGVVGTIYMRQGSLCIPGKTILTIHSKLQKLTFQFANNYAHISTGQVVTFNKNIISNVSNIYADAQNNLSTAEVLLKNINLPYNSFVTINVLTKQLKGIAIPINALLHNNHQTSVMVYKNNKFIRQDVTPLISNNQFVITKHNLKWPVACANESKLARLPYYDTIEIFKGNNNE